MTNIKNTMPVIALLLDSARGVYIPQNFIDGFDLSKWEGINQEDIDIILSKDEYDNLQSPYDIELYWDAWQEVLDNATFTENGNTWRLMQDGDLWAYCYELMSNEERENFGMDTMPTHEYYINLDERGEFSADVRDMAGNTVFEMFDLSLIEDGYMVDKNDIDGLAEFLINGCVIPDDSIIVEGN